MTHLFPLNTASGSLQIGAPDSNERKDPASGKETLPADTSKNNIPARTSSPPASGTNANKAHLYQLMENVGKANGSPAASLVPAHSSSSADKPEPAFPSIKPTDKQQKDACAEYLLEQFALQLSPDELKKKIRAHIESTGIFHIPFYEIPATEHDKFLKPVLRAAREACIKAPKATITYDFTPKLAYIKQPHSWEEMKRVLPSYLHHTGVRITGTDDKKNPIYAEDNSHFSINIDLSSLSPPYCDANVGIDKDFSKLMSALRTANIKKLSLDVSAFQGSKDYWETITKLMTKRETGADLADLSLDFHQTCLIDSDNPPSRRELADINKVAQKALAKAILDPDCKVKILRLTRFDFFNGFGDTSILRNALKERTEKGLPPIALMGGYEGNVPFDDLKIRDLFPAPDFPRPRP